MRGYHSAARNHARDTGKGYDDGSAPKAEKVANKVDGNLGLLGSSEPYGTTRHFSKGKIGYSETVSSASSSNPASSSELVAARQANRCVVRYAMLRRSHLRRYSGLESQRPRISSMMFVVKFR